MREIHVSNQELIRWTKLIGKEKILYLYLYKGLHLTEKQFDLLKKLDVNNTTKKKSQ